MSEFLSKDDFHEYVIDNRDRQDANKTEIIDTLQTAISAQKVQVDKDVGAVGGRVGKLEDYQKKQNFLAILIGAATTAILAFLK